MEYKTSQHQLFYITFPKYQDRIRELKLEIRQLEKDFDYRLAKKYNLIEETPRKIEFYFEWFDEQTKEKI